MAEGRGEYFIQTTGPTKYYCVAMDCPEYAEYGQEHWFCGKHAEQYRNLGPLGQCIGVKFGFWIGPDPKIIMAAYYDEKTAAAVRSVATQRRIAANTPSNKPGVFLADKSNSIFSLGEPRLKIDTSAIRTFNTGATRGSDEGKLDYEGFVSPIVTKRYAQFMDKNRRLPDGSLRGSDNWQEGIPKYAYVKSLVRHVEDVRLHHDNFPDEAVESIEDSLCAVIFNASGLLFEVLRDKRLAAKVKETLK